MRQTYNKGRYIPFKEYYLSVKNSEIICFNRIQFIQFVSYVLFTNENIFTEQKLLVSHLKKLFFFQIFRIKLLFHVTSLYFDTSMNLDKCWVE